MSTGVYVDGHELNEAELDQYIQDVLFLDAWAKHMGDWTRKEADDEGE